MLKALLDSDFRSANDGFWVTTGGEFKLVKTQKSTSFATGGFSQTHSSEPSGYFSDCNRPDTNFGLSIVKEIGIAKSPRD